MSSLKALFQVVLFLSLRSTEIISPDVRKVCIFSLESQRNFKYKWGSFDSGRQEREGALPLNIHVILDLQEVVQAAVGMDGVQVSLLGPPAALLLLG